MVEKQSKGIALLFFLKLEYQNNRSQVVAEKINSVLDHKNNEVANQWVHELEIPADIIKVPVSKIDVTELTVHELTEDNSK
ncbi:hypothetical protein [Erwinia amylovora]|uniref:Uncharacterized protein n=4 Tax=Erwinia amylovora TaxID=552 RepID=A0A830ZWK8_ERWAM|nr:hypothetical protein [Erwinia amylovora]ATZ12757.1 hypothetical protein AD997_15490 [Erwinia amylovora]EKV55253.1 hypothetical protein EaACW_0402 [Erwinia amylovora ACW56400]MBZ2388569.1 hypothetical protein [Erwinia amylovora]MBZ2395299.1 hypothetical protein [Erwinia amylovora]MBZ2399435.1 hypothetical protein [Erwinia amylovora]